MNQGGEEEHRKEEAPGAERVGGAEGELEADGPPSGDDVASESSTSSLQVHNPNVDPEEWPCPQAKRIKLHTKKPPAKLGVKCDRVYRYGNYDKYYGYRSLEKDPRVRALQQIGAGLRGKRWLDIGCNNGQLTTLLASQHCPTSVVGLDIDKRLIERARRLVASYTIEIPAPEYYPVSAAVEYGPLPIPDTTDLSRRITFQEGNMAAATSPVSGEFDVVLCLSVTKWVQLNYGDEGVKTLFSRVHSLLSPG
eukprot:Sspe_Gene.78240::Locus_48944_Transcript_1_1_Confidence_1.000_Length_752::g.78240::m.78240/K15190/MEPCE, BCDIN3; 7SK snRNA methylphosphate capping enzyme